MRVESGGLEGENAEQKVDGGGGRSIFFVPTVECVPARKGKNGWDGMGWDATQYNSCFGNTSSR